MATTRGEGKIKWLKMNNHYFQKKESPADLAARLFEELSTEGNDAEDTSAFKYQRKLRR